MHKYIMNLYTRICTLSIYTHTLLTRSTLLYPVDVYIHTLHIYINTYINSCIHLCLGGVVLKVPKGGQRKRL